MSRPFERSDFQCGTGVSPVGVAPPSRRCVAAAAPLTNHPISCPHTDLTAWCQRGGALPERLAAHIHHCAVCADQVRRASEVHVALKLMCTDPPPPDLPARANARALRFLRKASRVSAAAQRLLRIRPDLTAWQKSHLHLARLSMGAAAACLSLIVRAGVNTGLDHTRQLGETLAAQHWQRHIDPTGEWMAPVTRGDRPAPSPA